MTKLEAPSFIRNWPGKSAPAPDKPEHPAVYHMLDVAVVAEILIAPFQLPKPLQDALVLLAALHDLGKIGEEFRKMLRADKAGMLRSQRESHWEVAELLLSDHDDLLAGPFGLDSFERSALYAATAGHHGKPPKLEKLEAKSARKRIGQEAKIEAGEAIKAFLALWPQASLAGLEGPKSEEEITGLSWWLPGFVSAVDWIGSNQEWFDPVAPGPSPAEYLEDARKKARLAVAAAGLGGAEAVEGSILDFTTLRPCRRLAKTSPCLRGQCSP